MVWLLIDGVLALLAVLGLALAGLMLFRAVKALLRRAGRISTLLADAADGLAVIPPTASSGAPVLTVPSRPGRPRR